ncbi:secondary thiamine-phosphate synthase enzyme YjbQ [Bdellovibrio sp. 22V]|uniref:secondary thiamine-phosphate synthase enzyme YjbQ n=1 Tax=Bdellovibrio sp. 22V TaxID=3044166 RepID=UPI002543D424|nr:secondary thiamine-phosphate synthase enzyme YjbQ [Bdellovibrio sp. 22V]WII72816.1 secondary thiamine-phosphate synthase enzyme YjbQ [Bdellovibrio sp. 22V]
MLQDKDWCLAPHDATGFLKTEKVAEHKVAGNISWTEYLHFRVPKRYGLINITDKVEEVLLRSGVQDGLCYIGAMHITAGIYVNDAEAGLLHDISRWIERLAPFGQNYDHHRTGEDNGDAHLKSYLTNHQIVVPVTRGEFDFGTWQQIFYAEFDGLRDKRVLVKVVGLGNS